MSDDTTLKCGVKIAGNSDRVLTEGSDSVLEETTSSWVSAGTAFIFESNITEDFKTLLSDGNVLVEIIIRDFNGVGSQVAKGGPI